MLPLRHSWKAGRSSTAVPARGHVNAYGKPFTLWVCRQHGAAGAAGGRAHLQVADGEDGVVHLLVPASHGTFSLLSMLLHSCQQRVPLHSLFNPQLSTCFAFTWLLTESGLAKGLRCWKAGFLAGSQGTALKKLQGGKHACVQIRLPNFVSDRATAMCLEACWQFARLVDCLRLGGRKVVRGRSIEPPVCGQRRCCSKIRSALQC